MEGAVVTVLIARCPSRRPHHRRCCRRGRWDREAHHRATMTEEDIQRDHGNNDRGRTMTARRRCQKHRRRWRTTGSGDDIYHRRYRRLPSAICRPLSAVCHLLSAVCRLPSAATTQFSHSSSSLAAASPYHHRLRQRPLSIAATFKHHSPSPPLNGRRLLLPPAAAIIST